MNNDKQKLKAELILSNLKHRERMLTKVTEKPSQLAQFAFLLLILVMLWLMKDKLGDISSALIFTTISLFTFIMGYFEKVNRRIDALVELFKEEGLLKLESPKNDESL